MCLSQAIKFTDDAENALEDGSRGLTSLKKSLADTLRELTSLSLNDEPLLQLKMKAMVFDLVHYIDVIEQLQGKDTASITDWQWSKQLRYYFDKGKAVVKMHDAHFAYTYEYQGNAPKLVHTPLTDRCYLTLTQGTCSLCCA
jgi:dynein heavy chain 2